jgi:hypothetical protein
MATHAWEERCGECDSRYCRCPTAQERADDIADAYDAKIEWAELRRQLGETLESQKRTHAACREMLQALLDVQDQLTNGSGGFQDVEWSRKRIAAALATIGEVL